LGERLQVSEPHIVYYVLAIATRDNLQGGFHEVKNPEE
jgi:hypothetical protein